MNKWKTERQTTQDQDKNWTWKKFKQGKNNVRRIDEQKEHTNKRTKADGQNRMEENHTSQDKSVLYSNGGYTFVT